MTDGAYPVDPDDEALLGQLVDTWGQPCMIDGCEEFRTIGLAIGVLDDDGQEGHAVLPLCQEHLTRAVANILYERRGVIA